MRTPARPGPIARCPCCKRPNQGICAPCKEYPRRRAALAKAKRKERSPRGITHAPAHFNPDEAFDLEDAWVRARADVEDLRTLVANHHKTNLARVKLGEPELKPSNMILAAEKFLPAFDVLTATLEAKLRP